MKTTEIFNLDHLVSVRFSDAVPCKFFKWKPAIAFLGIIFRKEGFFGYMGNRVSEDYLLAEGYNVLNIPSMHIVFYKPNVILRFSDQTHMTIPFEETSQAKEFESYMASKIRSWRYDDTHAG
jgi:hypothetical protein